MSRSEADSCPFAAMASAPRPPKIDVGSLPRGADVRRPRFILAARWPLPPARPQTEGGWARAALSIEPREDGGVEANETSAPTKPSWTRLVWVLLPAVLFVALLGAALIKKSSPPAPGDQAPAFEAELLGTGDTLASEELRGKPVVMNFWASWCIPCEQEAPLLKKAHESYGDRISFLGVNIKDAEEDALAFDERWGLEYPDVRDENNEIFSDYGLTGQPETFFIDADGVIVEHVNGPVSAETLEVLLSRLLQND